MRTLSQLLTLAACLLLAMAAAAQNGTKIIKVTMTYNYALPSQTPATFFIHFDNNGNDSLTASDLGGPGDLVLTSFEVYPFTLTEDQQPVTGIDSRSQLNSYRAIPFGLSAKIPGDVKVIAELLSSDSLTPSPAFVWLEQVSTGERHNILDTAKFTIDMNPNFMSDFILHTGTTASSVGIDETCFNYSNGAVNVSGPNYPGFTLEFMDAMANPIFNAVVSGTDTLVPNLAPGNYVSVIRINGIPVDSTDVTINAASSLIADFTTDYNYVVPGTTVNFTDNSTGNIMSYIWDFGTGDSSATAGSESYVFSNTGTYTVNLQVTDINGCIASVFDVVTVDLPPAANNGGNSHHNIYSSNQRITIVLSSPASNVSIASINGTVQHSASQTSATAEYFMPVTGAYTVTIVNSDGSVQSTTLIVQ